MVHGMNPLSGALLATLGIDPANVSRFRDCFLARQEGGALEIHVYTRMGGGNRGHEHWAEKDDPLQQVDGVGCPCTSCRMEFGLSSHPNYLRDFDSDFDSTYATYVFSIPEAFREDLEQLVTLKPEAIPRSPADRFRDFMEKMQTRPEDPGVRRVVEALAPVFDAIKGRVP